MVPLNSFPTPFRKSTTSEIVGERPGRGSVYKSKRDDSEVTKGNRERQKRESDTFGGQVVSIQSFTALKFQKNRQDLK